ncbi:C6 zinc finger domain containing protein [Seiridium cupressi]
MHNSRNRLACASCTRRKVKCSKTVPCTNCIRRGEQNACGTSGGHAEEATPTPLIGIHDASSPTAGTEQHDLNAQLRRRVAELEAELHHRGRPSPASLPTSAITADAMRQDYSPTEHQLPGNQDSPHDTVVEDAASILEFLAWGRRKNPDYATVASPEAVVHAPQVGNIRDAHVQRDPPTAESTGLEELSQITMLQLLLPDKRRVWDLVLWHEKCLLWYHCSYYAPSLKKQLENFYDRCGGSIEHPDVNLQWVAVLFAVLTGSITCMPTHTAEHWGFTNEERETLAKRWFQAVMTCLNKADYAANHSILSVQAIATLTVTAHMLGFSNLHSIHLAAAVRIAQSLGLHRLTSDVPGGGIEKETGRRAWSQLCSQDWFSLPFSETYLINPLYSRSELPRNCHDDENITLPDSVPTVTGYSRFLHTIATIMPRLQDGLMSCNTPFTKYEQVMKWDKQLRTLATAGRPSYLSSIPLDPSWPVFIPWARRSLAISSSHKIIMIHRSFLSESFTNPAFAFTRRTCLAASKTIIKEYRRVIEEDGPVLWIHQAFSVAASVILILDILHRDQGEPEALEHLQLVEDVLEILKKRRNSMIASRGVKLLTALLSEILSNMPSNTSGRKRQAGSELDGSTQRGQKRMRTFNVTDFVKSFCSDPDNATRVPPQPQLSSLQASSQLMPADSFFDSGSFDGTSFENLLYLANQDFCSF